MIRPRRQRTNPDRSCGLGPSSGAPLDGRSRGGSWTVSCVRPLARVASLSSPTTTAPTRKRLCDFKVFTRTLASRRQQLCSGATTARLSRAPSADATREGVSAAVVLDSSPPPSLPPAPPAATKLPAGYTFALLEKMMTAARRQRQIEATTRGPARLVQFQSGLEKRHKTRFRQRDIQSRAEGGELKEGKIKSNTRVCEDKRQWAPGRAQMSESLMSTARQWRRRQRQQQQRELPRGKAHRLELNIFWPQPCSTLVPQKRAAASLMWADDGQRRSQRRRQSIVAAEPPLNEPLALFLIKIIRL
jgi:hypothetical protein